MFRSGGFIPVFLFWMFTVPAVYGAVIFQEDFSNGLAGWSATGLWQATTLCAAPQPGCSSGTFAYYGRTDMCTFNTGSTTAGTLTSPSIVLPVNPNITLSYCSRRDTEGGAVYDRCFVKVGPTLDKVDTVLTDDGLWEARSATLTKYGGQTVQLVFEFDSVDSDFNNYLGWQVDNVVVSDSETLNCPNPADVLIRDNLIVTSTIKKTSVKGGARIVQVIKIKNNNPTTVSGLTLLSPYNPANALIKGSAKAPGSSPVSLVAGAFRGLNVITSGATTLSIPSRKTLKATIAWRAISCPAQSPQAYDFGPAIAVISVSGSDICLQQSSSTPAQVCEI